MDDPIGLLLLMVPVGYLLSQVFALRTLHGTWRLASALPLPLWALWAALLVVDLAGDPTSHNLFPFEIVIGASLAMVYLGVLVALRGLIGRHRP